MKDRISRFAAIITAVALVSTPVAVQANTRAPEMPTYAAPSDNDHVGAAGAASQNKPRRLSRDWLVTLFGTAATVGALAILFSGKSAGETPRRPRGEPDGPVQSNGAT